MELERVLKRQGLSPTNQGMVTAGEESPAHLNAGKVHFFGLVRGVTLSRACASSLYAQMSPAGGLTHRAMDTYVPHMRG